MVNFNNMAEIISLAKEKDLPIHEIVIAREMHTSLRRREDLVKEMAASWQVKQ